MDVESQIKQLRKEVAYDTRDFTIEIIVNKYKEGFDDNMNEIYVPEYQRDFVWDENRQSKMIESIMLGLPIPSIFIAEDDNGRFEIVDGSQRIRTLNAFIHDELELTGLQKITSLNGHVFSSLDISRQRKFRNTVVSIIVLAETASDEMKNDLFERINKGADLLRNMETRKGIYHGPFTDFVYKECSINEKFREMVILSKSVKNRQEYEELIVRFFAMVDSYPKYTTFSRSVTKALDEYMQSENERFSSDIKESKKIAFNRMIDFVADNFMFGFSKAEGMETSRILFEAISVGVHLALEKKSDLTLSEKVDVRYWTSKKEFAKVISSEYKTHAVQTLRGRVEFVRDSLIKLSNNKRN
ncbi:MULTISPECIES: DUF262 domain-containing protein [unclassified Serratia (in: enterobacteria)]|uniref:DUF262 domain-containing protein n=1 Tax=unclassified Serratia (in: enterobacteria) TaxID=2647522 RepID=UPI000907C9FD|nr:MULTISPECIES: DUF262 domain-containing protein [unclassified Serratia (in: enterobacteria)]